MSKSIPLSEDTKPAVVRKSVTDAWDNISWPHVIGALVLTGVLAGTVAGITFAIVRALLGKL